MVELAYALNGLAFAKVSRGAAVVKRGTCSRKSRKRSCVCLCSGDFTPNTSAFLLDSQ